MSIFFKFFIKSGWTKLIVAVIFCALFVFPSLSGERLQNVLPGADSSGAAENEPVPDELGILQGESALLRRELSEVLLKYNKLNEELLKYDVGIASISNVWPADQSAERTKNMIEYFETVGTMSEQLKSDISELELLIRKILDKDKPDDTDKARVRAELQYLMDNSAKLANIAKGFFVERNQESCELLAINDKLQVVAINAGSLSGIRCGMLCRAISSSGKEIVIKVVSVRPFVSAAVVIEGDIKNLLPGMNVKIGTVN